MKIAVYGTGYVGLVSGLCLSELGHQVCCLDIDQEKVNLLQRGELPIYEEGLAQLLQNNIAQKAITFTTCYQATVNFADLQLIAVGTPPQANGAIDLSYVETVVTQIAELATADLFIVTKSTVPVGTAEWVEQTVKRIFKRRGVTYQVNAIANPEFLREGKAVIDFMQPDRIIVGVKDDNAAKKMQALYEPLTRQGYPMLLLDRRSAELTKYAANAFLATKISFINEMSHFAELLGADIEQVKQGLVLDARIASQSMNPGCGFGGSCFPKDVLALHKMAQQQKLPSPMIDAVLQINQQQQKLLFTKLNEYYAGQLQNKRIAVWGLAFKPDTDDVRCASSLVVIKNLLAAGAKVVAYDPQAMRQFSRVCAPSEQLILVDNAVAALKDADALLLMTEWDEFKQFDLSQLSKMMARPVMFDGRNLYDLLAIKQAGVEYFAIGRPKNLQPVMKMAEFKIRSPAFAGDDG